MIVDSHAHYAHNSFLNEFRYLDWDGNYALETGTLEQLLDIMAERGISMSVEPGISLASNDAILALAGKYPDRIFPAIGVHPTRCFKEQWRDRKRLKELLKAPGVVAVGELGLDYHHPRPEQHRLVQMAWFAYQLKLARANQLPLILHIRMAQRDAIRILKLFGRHAPGGVVHCFGEDWDTAKAYLDLGYHIGIGGTLLQLPERSGKLRYAVKQIPLDRIVVETDSPYVLPYCKDVLQPKLVRRARNTSLILPAVIGEIARIKGLPPQQVERATAENAIRLFRLPDLQE